MIIVLVLAVLLTAKHFLWDIVLQPTELVNGKRLGGTEGLGHLATHAFFHGIGTFLIFSLLQFSMPLIALITLLDFTTHFVIDFGKVQVEKFLNPLTKSKKWYTINIVDQTLHFVCYAIFIWLVI